MTKMKSKENEFEIISITFKDFKGNEHILTEQTQELKHRNEKGFER